MPAGSGSNPGEGAPSRKKPAPPAPPENQLRGAFEVGMSGPVDCGPPPMMSMAPLTWMPAGPVPVAEPDAAGQARFEAAAGDAFYSQGQFRAALSRSREPVALRPEEPQSHYKLARAARRAEEPQSVEPHLLE